MTPLLPVNDAIDAVRTSPHPTDSNIEFADLCNMPTVLAHPFVAMGLTPAFRSMGVSSSIIALGAFCTLVPDLDVVGFYLGIPYGSLFGHRGFSHSLVFAILLSGLCVLLLRPKRLWPAWIYLFLCTVSHGLLDAFTNGGYGIAFFSPFSNERYFFPWRPIEVSPLSITQFIYGRANEILLNELLWVVLPFSSLALLTWVIVRNRA